MLEYVFINVCAWERDGTGEQEIVHNRYRANFESIHDDKEQQWSTSWAAKYREKKVQAKFVRLLFWHEVEGERALSLFLGNKT